MGLDRHPQLQSMLFGNYRRLVYLAQIEDPDLEQRARGAAERLGLDYEYRYTGYGELGETLAGVRRHTMNEKEVQWRPS